MPKLVFKLSDSRSLDFPLAGERIRLGRNGDNEIVIDNSWISSFHAEFRLKPDGVMEVQDLNSSNGTTVNGKPIETADLKNGDIVAFGQLEAVFDSLAESAAPVKSRTPRKAAAPATQSISSRTAKPPVVIPRPGTGVSLPRPPAPVVPTEPVPPPVSASAGAPPHRPAVPTPAPVARMAPPAELELEPTAPMHLPVPAGESLQARHAAGEDQETAALLRSEITLLSEKVASLRKECESEEMKLIRLREEGARETASLQILLKNAQAAVAKADADAVAADQTRKGEAAQAEAKIAAGIAGLQSREETLAHQVKEREARLTEIEKAVADAAAQLTGMETTAAEETGRHRQMMDDLAAEEKKKSALAAEMAVMETEKQKLESAVAAAAGRLTDLTAQCGETERNLRARQAELETAARSVAEQEAARGEREALAREVSALSERHAETNLALASSTATLESLRGQIAAARAEASVLEERRAEASALHARAIELDRTVQKLEERRQTFADAPDAHWGTVHAMAKGLIKQVDLLDDLIGHLAAVRGSEDVIRQMRIFHAGLIDILHEYSVTSYTFEAGQPLDLTTRKKIQIVESHEDDGEGTRVRKTCRPGYLCSNGPLGVHVLLRKAEVSVLLGRQPVVA